MQAFGKFATEHDLEYLVEHYIYFNAPEETLTAEELPRLLKKRNKTVAGTIFLYNPVMAPKGMHTDTPLAQQGYAFDGKYTELQSNKLMDIFQARIKGFDGMLMEIKYLFNYNRPDIEPTSALETFNEDIEKLPSFQLTRFSREYNYHDVKNIRLSGKFIFFAWGNRFDRHHPHILAYAKSIFEQSRKIGKEAAYVYDPGLKMAFSEEGVRFLPPVVSGKLKTRVTEAIAKAFSTNPPQPTPYEAS
jgi:hypothetical protein